MKENVIEFLKDHEIATVTLTQERYINKVEKLAEQYPDECEIIARNKDGSILAHVPVDWIKITHPRVYSEEVKAKYRATLHPEKYGRGVTPDD